MSFTIGDNIKVTVFGQSHADAVGVIIDGLPAGKSIDMDEVNSFLKRRAGGNSVYTTSRREKDEPVILSGILDGKTVGAPVCAVFPNENAKRKDYDALKSIPRPSHADFTAFYKYQGKADMSGGGHFSARLTLPMCFAGAVLRQLLKEKGVDLGAHILRIGDIEDEAFSDMTDAVEHVNTEGLPVILNAAGDKMDALMKKTAAEGDSIGGIIECKVTGMPIGAGDPIYDSLESRISYGMFGIPAVKGIEFGLGFGFAKANGSVVNDSFCIEDNKIRCRTNNSGGIQGGMSNGMPIIFRVAMKPTPSIYKEQRSVDLSTMKEVSLKIEGRHDSCIVPRAVPCVEAMCAIILYDVLSDGK